MIRRLSVTRSWLCLVLVLAGAAVIRLAGNDWDSYQFLHPDERFLLMVTSALRWPASPSQYFDEAHSPLNPRNQGFSFFAYGTWPVIFLRGLSSLADITQLESLARLGRVTSALFDLGTTLLVYLIALRLTRDRRVGLLGALLYGSFVLPIQQAHFFVVDPPLSFFLTAALYWCLRLQEIWRWPAALLAGLCLGLALSCKITAILFLPVAGVALLPGVRSRTNMWRFALVGLTALFVWRVADPYVFASASIWNFAPASRWLANLAESGRLSSGEADVPPGIQWAGRVPILFPWAHMVVYGMGLFAGVAAWIAWGAAAWRIAIRKRTRLLLPVVWIALLMLLQGTRWVTTMRYFLPIYSSLAVLAAWLLVRALDLTRRRTSLRQYALGFNAAVLIATLAWAVAFTAIYRAPNTRVAASEWIYRNIPLGDTIASEHWDDGLPLRMHGLDPYGNIYHGVQLKWFDDDTPAKVQQVLDELDRADWLILSSNRLYDAIPRLPMRFPMTTRYYEVLFRGELGFTKVQQFTSFPRLGPLNISTRHAEEAFTVYDHPAVMIFRKTPLYSRQRAEQLLSAVDWNNVVRAPARLARVAPTGLLLTPERWNAQLNGGTWSVLFPAQSFSRRAPALCLLALLYLLAFAVTPLLFLLCPALPDRGYGLTKAAGLVLTGWLIWLGASTTWLNFERPWIWTVVLLLAFCSARLTYRTRVDLGRFFRVNWPLVLVSEFVFLLAFAYMGAVRRGGPDLWQPFFGGEKPMDLAYLTAVVRSVHFPAYGPWLAGSYLNYYYYGFVLVAYLLKATAVPPEIGYNVAIALLYATTAVGVFSVAAALAGRGVAHWRRMATGAAAVILVLLAGNLKQIELYTSAIARLSAGAQLPTLGIGGYWLAFLRGLAVSAQHDWDPGVGAWTWYFDAARAYNHAPGEPVPVTEFPFFTFSFGDLHAHTMALPIFVLLLGLLIALAQSDNRGTRAATWGLWAAVAIALGALPVTNGWDYPAAALLLAIACYLRTRHLLQAVLYTSTALAAAWCLYLPFHYWYAPGFGAFTLWHGSRTALIPFLLVYGLFLLLLTPVLMNAARFRLGQRWLAIAILLAGAAAGDAVTTLLLLVLFCAAKVLWREREFPIAAIAWAFAAVGLLLALVPEWIVLKGDIGRMNTVFKFGFQAWTLLGISAAVAFSALAGEWRLWQRPWRTAWHAVATVAFAGSLVYALTSQQFRMRDRFDNTIPPTWNGMSMLERSTHRQCDAHLELNDDLNIIRWLRDHAEGTPVVAEYNTRPVVYGWGNRIAMFTGLPAIAGWDHHLRQQFGWFDSGRIAKRIDDVQAIYAPGEPANAWRLLRQYDAKYVVWGALERACVPAAATKFEQGREQYWRVVYEGGANRVYSVNAVPAAAIESAAKR